MLINYVINFEQQAPDKQLICGGSNKHPQFIFLSKNKKIFVFFSSENVFFSSENLHFYGPRNGVGILT